jgi:Protein of unknown function (DUF1153)
MQSSEGNSKNHVIGPCGHVLTRETLPTEGTKRWVPRRKAEVVAAVRGGLLTADEAYERYRLTAEEFMAWQEAIDQFGLAGLRVSHTRL